MGTLALRGLDATIWGSKLDRDSHKQDLIALKPRAKKDTFSVWIAESAIFHLIRCGCSRFMKRSRIHGSVGYEDSTVYRMTYWLTGILASLIPITSIAILYQVQSMPARLGIIAVFNVLLSVCLMGLANAKRSEVFAISAAYVMLHKIKHDTDLKQICCSTSCLHQYRSIDGKLRRRNYKVGATVLVTSGANLGPVYVIASSQSQFESMLHRSLCSLLMSIHIPTESEYYGSSKQNSWSFVL